MATLYAYIVEFMAAAEHLTSPFGYSGEPRKEEEVVKAGEHAQTLWEYFLKHKLYFREDVCEKVETLFRAVTSKLSYYSLTMRQANLRQEDHLEHHRAWEEAWSTMRNDVPPLMHAIENEFRAILGVVDATPGRACTQP